jgi:hypothetical protein
MKAHIGTREIGTGAAGRRAQRGWWRAGLLAAVLGFGASAAWAAEPSFVVEPGGEAGLVRALREGEAPWPAGYEPGEVEAR